MFLRGFFLFKIRSLILLTLLTGFVYAGAGLTVLSLPEDPVKGWLKFSSDSFSGAATWPLFLPEKGIHYHASHTFWMFDTPYSRVVAGNRKFFTGASLIMTEGIEIRTDVATEQPVDETGYYNGVLLAGREWIVNPKFRIGTTGQLVFERLYHASALGLAINAAGVYRLSENTIITAGVKNLGKMQQLYRKSTPMPLHVYTGVMGTYRGLGTALEMNVDEQGVISGAYLLEYKMDDVFSAGMSYSGAINSWHVGGTLHYKQFSFGIGQYFLQDQIAYPIMLSIAYSPQKE